MSRCSPKAKTDPQCPPPVGFFGARVETLEFDQGCWIGGWTAFFCTRGFENFQREIPEPGNTGHQQGVGERTDPLFVAENEVA